MWIVWWTISKQRQAYVAHFQFVTVQGTPDKSSDKAAKRLARSHAVKQALQKKRQRQQESMQHFSVRTLEDEQEQSRRLCKRQGDRQISPSPVALSASLLDPFQSLPVNSKRLQILLNDFNARQAPEPVFSVEDDFQNFKSVFRSGLIDPALLNAVMLSLAFTANGGVINKECLVYRGQAIQRIRERIIGVEARLGTTSQVQLHMGAIQYLLNACEPVVVNLTEGIKRAIFCTGTTGFIGGDAFYALHKAHPDWKYTILVRSEDKGKDVQKQYPDVKLAIGSLDDSKVIEKAASEADIVIHTADSSDHQGAAKAIAAGLRSTHSSSNPGYWIHISGTGILCWYDMDNKRYGEGPLPEQAYDDLEGVDKVTSLPDNAFHRDVDKIVLDEAAKDPSAVKVAVVCPPTIYGTGRGPANQRSRQIPGLTETTLEKGFGPIIGAGETEWDNVHVHDLSNLIVLLSDRAASSEKQSDEQEIWGPKGYFFAENGKHKWSQISALIAKEAKKQGVIDSDETKVLDVDEAQKKLGFQALSWGLNSRGEAKRARKYLGWKPVGESLEEWIPESVKIEAKRLNKA
ncbi:nucleoside diphosphate sugar epimerase [Fusarium circinatum]|uniref:Nucleoside diphosphate sugar epimerase n=1 Tax=Fusarium circinatum TaxID=48490 RepID=A0A8H5X3V5_FUSCI|nr:nucleoside diphosphate sugar epimerase [Fusarium circinatum]